MRTQCRWGHIIDVVPTCLAVVGGEYPRTYAGEEIRPLEGMSLLPAFQGKARQEDQMARLYTGYIGDRINRTRG